MALKSLFVTKVYEASLAEERGFPVFNRELEDACRMLALEDVAGREVIFAEGFADGVARFTAR